MPPVDYVTGNGNRKSPRLLPSAKETIMHAASLGEQLRDWRTRRRMSQMDLALDTDMSTRHLSFIETGRSKPSSQMLLRIADRLEVPHRARNALLIIRNARSTPPKWRGCARSSSMC
jgi:predicted transcriptional regulator